MRLKGRQGWQPGAEVSERKGAVGKATAEAGGGQAINKQTKGQSKMKTYEQLTEAERKVAVERATNNLLQAIVAGQIRFNDKLNGDDLQARIDAASAEAERKQTPWFMGEIVMADTVCAEKIRGMAQADAEDALYPAPSECVMEGIALAPA